MNYDQIEQIYFAAYGASYARQIHDHLALKVADGLDRVRVHDLADATAQQAVLAAIEGISSRTLDQIHAAQ